MNFMKKSSISNIFFYKVHSQSFLPQIDILEIKTASHHSLP